MYHRAMVGGGSSLLSCCYVLFDCNEKHKKIRKKKKGRKGYKPYEDDVTHFLCSKYLFMKTHNKRTAGWDGVGVRIKSAKKCINGSMAKRVEGRSPTPTSLVASYGNCGDWVVIVFITC